MSKPIIIGLCGSTIAARQEALESLASQLGEHTDLTISGGVRAAWRRGDALFDALDELPVGHSPVLCKITCHEEAESIEMKGGHVIHIEGNPSDDISIERHSILLTLKDEGRGRYITVSEAVEKLKAA